MRATASPSQTQKAIGAFAKTRIRSWGGQMAIFASGEDRSLTFLCFSFSFSPSLSFFFLPFLLRLSFLLSFSLSSFLSLYFSFSSNFRFNLFSLSFSFYLFFSFSVALSVFLSLFFSSLSIAISLLPFFFNLHNNPPLFFFPCTVIYFTYVLTKPAQG